MLLNAIQKDPLYKVTVYSEPGLGKTHIGATAPDPLILLFERHGMETVRTAAKMQGGDMPPVIWVRTIQQLQRIQKVLASAAEPLPALMRDPDVIDEGALMEAGLDREDLVASLPYTRPKTIVIDSVTEACEMLAAHIDEHGGKETKDGLTYRKLRAWGPIAEKCTRLIRAFRDLPYHVLFLALVEERNLGSEDHPEIHYRPDLPGRTLWKKLVAACNAVGMLVRRRKTVEDDKGNKSVKTVRCVMFMTNDIIATKHAAPLRAREPADAGAWFYALEHKVPTSDEVEDIDDAPPAVDAQKKAEAAEGKK